MHLLFAILASLIAASSYAAPLQVGRRLSRTSGVVIAGGTVLCLVELLFVTLLWHHTGLGSGLATTLGVIFWIQFWLINLWSIAPYVNRTAYRRYYSSARAWVVMALATYEIVVIWVYYLH